MTTKTKTLLIAAQSILLGLMGSAAPNAVAAAPLVLSDVRWDVTPDTGKEGAPRLRIRHSRSSSDQSLDGSRADFAAAMAALGRDAAGPVQFEVTHEAGTLVCTGTLRRRFEGEGDCRFTSDPDFERKLGERRLAPERRETLLAMLMVDATIELADALIREGVRPADANDLIAVAALKVTPQYIHELKAGGLALSSVEDAIACKALGVDGDYVRGLTAAGYSGLSADDVVGMKALNVTPDYARAMNAAAKEAGQ